MRILWVLLSMLAAPSAWALEAVEANYRGEAFVAGSKQFYMEYCTDQNCQEKVKPSFDEKDRPEVLKLVVDEIARDVRRSLYIMGFEVENWSVVEIDEAKLMELLQTDYSNGDGDFPMAQQDLKKVADYLSRFKGKVKIHWMQVVSEYMSGTGIESYFLLYNTATDWVTVIQRLEYAE